MGLYIKVKEIRQIREIAIHLIFSRGDNPPPPLIQGYCITFCATRRKQNNIYFKESRKY